MAAPQIDTLVGNQINEGINMETNTSECSVPDCWLAEKLTPIPVNKRQREMSRLPMHLLLTGDGDDAKGRAFGVWLHS